MKASYYAQRRTAHHGPLDLRETVELLSDLFWIKESSDPDDYVDNLLRAIGFEKFQASRTEKVNGDGGDGFFYDDAEGATVHCYLNGLGILDNGAEAEKGKRYFLILDRSDWESDDLEELEKRLFAWALTEGWTV